MNPKVTVLMPVYNGEKYLQAAIDSILSQTFSDFEFLIIDDGCIDGSVAIINTYTDPRIRLVHNDINLGLIASLNKGLDLAKGEYVARQDADDISKQTRLEKQVSFLDSHPEVALLGTRVDHIDQTGRKIKVYGWFKTTTELAIRWQLIFDNPFAHSSVMMRTLIVREIGGYDNRYVTCEDYDLWSRLACKYSAVNLKEELIAIRSHSGSVTANSTKENNMIAGDIYRRTFSYYLNNDPPEEWITLWLSINNPYNFTQSVCANKLMFFLEFIHRRFISVYPVAHNNMEIEKHISNILARISYNIALKDRRASIYCFFQVFLRDCGLACRFFPKYLAALFLGPYRKMFSQKFRCGSHS